MFGLGFFGGAAPQDMGSRFARGESLIERPAKFEHNAGPLDFSRNVEEFTPNTTRGDSPYAEEFTADSA